MIVFWRLVLAFFLTNFVFFHKTINRMEEQNRPRAYMLHAGVFLFWAFALCYDYLTMKWPFLGFWHIPGWLCILLFCAFLVFSDRFFQFGGKIRHGHVLTFFTKTIVNLLFLFLCVPFKVLYETGNLFAEPWIIFCVGLVTATRVLGWFIFAIEQDRYGRDYPTFDERWLLTMQCAISFLIMLLPGWRWIVLFVVWYLACMYARKIRLMDVSTFAFYMGGIGASVIGFLVRLRFYLNW